MSASRLNFLLYLSSNWKNGGLAQRGTTMILSDSTFLIMIMSYLLRSWLLFSDSHCTDLVRSLKGLLHKIFGLLLQGGLITPPKVQRPQEFRTLFLVIPKKV